jgi:hypothetical protein
VWVIPDFWDFSLWRKILENRLPCGGNRKLPASVVYTKKCASLFPEWVPPSSEMLTHVFFFFQFFYLILTISFRGKTIEVESLCGCKIWSHFVALFTIYSVTKSLINSQTLNKKTAVRLKPPSYKARKSGDVCSKIKTYEWAQ